uniref:UPAR/Ly6 domain-containing protein n=1 Tax=Cyclopterus lumpus TaxID=8103 RepID=A0A8C3G0E2_CYCLU
MTTVLLLFSFFKLLCFYLCVSADSLTCNKCSFGLLGYCVSSTELTCTTNTSVCFTAKASFNALTTVGFNSQGCREPAQCNMTTNGTLVGITYETKVECCAADKCNSILLSSAPSTKMSYTAAIGLAVLASMCGSLL